MNVALIGGGSSAHLLAALLGNRGHRVRILTSRPSEWRRDIELVADGDTIIGRVDGVSDDPSAVVEDANVAVLCMPVHQYSAALSRIMPYVARNQRCIVGTVYGQAGFDWMVQGAAREAGVPVPPHFAVGLLPWIARTLQYGAKAVSYGPKFRNGVATSDAATHDFLASSLLPDFSYSYWGTGAFERIPNFLTITLTVDNQIIHPSRCYALATSTDGWEDAASIPYFYRDWDDRSAEILKGVDVDYSNVRAALFGYCPRLSTKYNLDYLSLEHWSYGSHNPDIKASFVNSTTLGHIKPPTVLDASGRHVFDVNHRFFKDDFAYGLEICRWFADEMSVEVPHVQKLIDWYRSAVQPRQNQAVRPGVPPVYQLGMDDILGGGKLIEFTPSEVYCKLAA